MRLALVIYGELSRLSGGYLYDRMLVEDLRRRGDEVQVVSLPWRDYLRHMGDNVSADLLDRMADPSFDLVLQDELNHPSLFLLNRRLRRRSRSPVVSIVHHLRSSEGWPAWQNSLHARVERSYLRTVDGLVCNSRNTSGQVQRLIGARSPFVISLPGKDHIRPSITDDDIKARANEAGPLRVLFVGNVIPRKGLHVLVDALASLPEGSVELTVVGSLHSDARYAAGVQQRARRRGLEAMVDFRGSVPLDTLLGQFVTHHAVAVPSAHEGFGIAYLEAAGFGLPSIASTRGGAGEFVHHGVSGFVLPPVDSAIAEHLRWWHEDRRLLLDMSLAAKRAYEAHPTWEQGAAETRAFLQEMVGQ